MNSIHMIANLATNTTPPTNTGRAYVPTANETTVASNRLLSGHQPITMAPMPHYTNNHHAYAINAASAYNGTNATSMQPQSVPISFMLTIKASQCPHKITMLLQQIKFRFIHHGSKLLL